MRLNRYLALSGVNSRRKCDKLISSKQIKINGEIVDDFSYSVKENDIVQYKNSIIYPKDSYKFYLINTVTSNQWNNMHCLAAASH